MPCSARGDWERDSTKKDIQNSPSDGKDPRLGKEVIVVRNSKDWTLVLDQNIEMKLCLFCARRINGITILAEC